MRPRWRWPRRARRRSLAAITVTAVGTTVIASRNCSGLGGWLIWVRRAGSESMMPPRCVRLLHLDSRGLGSARPRRLRQRGHRALRGRPELRGRGAFRRALLGLSHARGRRSPGLGRPRAAQPGARTSTSARRPPRTSSTRSETAASRARSCPRTSSSARRPRGRRVRRRVLRQRGRPPDDPDDRARHPTSHHESRAQRARPESDPRGPGPGPGRRSRAAAPPRRSTSC